jgi:hypothetical protein
MARNGCAVKAISVTRHPVSSAFTDRRPGNAGCSERACLVTQSGRAVDRHAAGASFRSAARFQPSGSVRTRRIGLLARPKMATWSDCVWGCPQLLLANPLAKLAVAHLPRELHRDRRNYLAVSRPGQPQRRARPARLRHHRGRKPIPRVGGLDQLRFCRRNPADLRSLIASGDDTKHRHVTDGKVLYDRQSARRVEHDRTGRAVAQHGAAHRGGRGSRRDLWPTRRAACHRGADGAKWDTASQHRSGTGRARADRADRAARHGRDTAAPQPGRQPGPGAGAGAPGGSKGWSGPVVPGLWLSGPRQSAPAASGRHSGRWPHRAGFTAPDSQSALSGRRECAVLPDASALLADPHRYVGGFQGLVYDSGQVVPD